MDEVIIATGIPDVQSNNYEEFDQEIDPSKLGTILVQENTLKGTRRTYQPYAGRYLLLDFVEKKKAAAKNFRVNLAWLSTEPRHTKIIMWNWLLAALSMMLVTGIAIYLTVAETIPSIYGYITIIICLSSGLIFSLIFIYLMRDEYTFESLYGGIDLFVIENKRPNPSEFDAFYTTLQQNIKTAQANISVTERLVGELKMCRRLRDEGIISDDAYTVARTAIFKHEQYKA